MPTSRAYIQKRREYMSMARRAKCQLITMPPKHKPALRRVVTSYASMAREMNHKALALQRFEDEAEFRSRVRRLA